MSLAQTYKDDKQYDKAIENYQAEIRCRGEGEGDQVGILDLPLSIVWKVL